MAGATRLSNGSRTRSGWCGLVAAALLVKLHLAALHAHGAVASAHSHAGNRASPPAGAPAMGASTPARSGDETSSGQGTGLPNATVGLPAANVWPAGTPWSTAQLDAVSEVFTSFNIEPSFNIRIFHDEYISEHARYHGYYGPLPLIQEMTRGVTDGLIVDVGANIGMVTMFAAALGHRVIAFEPLEENYAMALASLSLNPGFKDRVRLYQRVAHWDSRPLTLARNPTVTAGVRNSGCATLDPSRLDGVEGEGGYTVLPLTVDAAVGPSEVVQVLKIDVEGCACHVLRSAERLINAMRVLFLEMEVLPRDVCGCDHVADMTWLMGLGYVPLAVQGNRLEKVSADVVLQGIHTDLTFAHPRFIVER